jgi:hypothetical protein
MLDLATRRAYETHEGKTVKLQKIVNQSKQLTPGQTKWLNTCVKGTWSLTADGLVDVEGDVKIPQATTKLLVGFGSVSGDFWCNETKITSLAGGPHSVGRDFYCNDTKITSLAGGPHSVGGHFDCNYTKITSLAGGPHSVGRDFWCSHTDITSLAGGPHSVGGDFLCNDTPLAKSHLLAFFKTKAIKSVWTGYENEHVDAILNKYLNGDRDMLLCQDELIDAGFGGAAKL